jgi:outer membrane protein assembly factor BamB
VLGFKKQKSEVMTVAGNQMMMLSPVTGEVKDTFAEDYTITCLPALNGGYYYIGGDDGIIRAVGVKDKVGIHDMTGEFNSEIISIFYHDNYGVIFATKAGSIVSANKVLLSKLWDFSVSEGLSVPVSLEGDYLYAIGNDAKLYRISLADGSLDWKTPVGMPEDHKPVVGEKNVYHLTEDKELTAVDKSSGKIVWQLENAKTAVNEINGKSYIASNGGLKVIDSATGEIERELLLDKNCIYGVNLDDELIYIADRIGNICCIKPIK